MAFSLVFFDGFDIPIFKPGAGKASVPAVIPKWSGYRNFTAEDNASFWDNLYADGRLIGSKSFRHPLSFFKSYNIPSDKYGCVVGLGFKWDNSPTVKNALIASAWSSDWSSCVWSVEVNNTGNIQIAHGGSWNKDAATWGRSGHTVVATSSSSLAPGEWKFIEILAAFGSSPSIKVLVEGELWVSGTVPSFSGTVNLWIGSNYSYKNASNELVVASHVDDFYFGELGSPSDQGLGDVYVWTKQPDRVSVAEWNATNSGHVASVAEGYIANPNHDNQFVWTSQRDKRELWGVTFPVTDIHTVVGVQLTAYGKLEGNFPPDKVVCVMRKGTSMLEFVTERVVDEETKEYYMVALSTVDAAGGSLDASDLNNQDYGVKTTL